MQKYPKIQTLFKRDMANQGRIMTDRWSLPEFEYLKDNQWTFTEKVDGTNIRLRWQRIDGRMVLRVGGKSDNAQIPTSLLDAITAMQLESRLQATFPDTEACLYGEGYGPGIQKGGGNYRQTKSFVLFDVLCGELWLQRDDVHDIAVTVGLDVVPVVGTGTLKDAIDYTRKGFDSRWGNFQAEGLVLRPATELRTRRGDRVIAKLKHVDFVGEKF